MRKHRLSPCQARAPGRGAGARRAGRRAGAHRAAAPGRGLEADRYRGESGRCGRQRGGSRSCAQRRGQPYLPAQSVDDRIGQSTDVRQHAVQSAAGPAAGCVAGQQPVVPVCPVFAWRRYARRSWSTRASGPIRSITVRPETARRRIWRASCSSRRLASRPPMHRIAAWRRRYKIWRQVRPETARRRIWRSELLKQATGIPATMHRIAAWRRYKIWRQARSTSRWTRHGLSHGAGGQAEGTGGGEPATRRRCADIRTFSEAGIGGVFADSLFGVYAAAGTRDDVVDRRN